MVAVALSVTAFRLHQLLTVGRRVRANIRQFFVACLRLFYNSI
jgi:hypothetical protein